MFDLSRAAEIVGGFIGSSGAAAATEPGDIGTLLESVGLDPSVLSGLTGPEITELLQGYGIDPSQWGEGQLNELLGATGLSALASNLLGDGRG